ncbi:hypothetical protein [Dermatobacter hominis]|uniref:hypothetical protein n=1 Tax=Dermatobacter hominis TaxID=2884263 RepID=UPI001D10010B|nr:hypothetical protein [Dermatobacter hominis]UDY35617.1 hypothetical protein LH044_20075 [Dermatobacter hominis]
MDLSPPPSSDAPLDGPGDDPDRSDPVDVDVPVGGSAARGPAGSGTAGSEAPGPEPAGAGSTVVEPGFVPGEGTADGSGSEHGLLLAGGPDDDEERRDPAEPLVEVDDPEHGGRQWADLVSWVVVGLTCLFIFASLSPAGIFSTNTPTGGDMGAHVWGPAYLRDDLLPHLRLTGWTPDWYAGFPAYVFYMVIPSLLIVMINVGPPVWLSPFLLAALAFVGRFVYLRVTHPVLRTFLWIVIGVLAILSVPVPYEVAFKLVTVSGLVTLPLAAFALARSFKMPFPGPALVAVGAAAFLYETGYTILGGNITSTMAGEFAFSISLTLCLLYLAVLVRGVRTGRDMALAATLFGLVVLCHIIPAMFAVAATVIFLLTRREDRVPWWDSFPVARGIAAGLVAVTLLTLVFRQGAFPIVVSVVLVLLFVGLDLRAVTFSTIALPVGGLLACFWFVPFFLDSPFMNDMGWEKYTKYAEYLWPQQAQFDMPYRNVVFALAALGLLLSIVHRQRIGWYLALVVLAMAWAFRYAPQWRLWNARILPFYYLAIYLLAAVAVALVIRSIALVVAELSRRREEPALVGVIGVSVVVALLAVLYGGALRILPGGQVTTDASGVTAYEWLGLRWTQQNVSSGWAQYNYEGLEGREAYPEFRSIVDTMADVGEEHGCGRAMWEYEPTLSRFGTPMALMLLPYFTDGCIGSMEGLYFEASSTTPFHFLNQSELSSQPSRAQRDMPYSGLDLQLGISHLQMMGVKYYLATSDAAIAAARADDRLTELQSITPAPTADGLQHQWVVFEVADADLVTSLSCKPVVLEGTDDHIDGWVYAKERAVPALGQEVGAKLPGPAVKWYQDPARWNVPLATSGPSDWPRVSPDDASPPCEDVPEVTVSNVRDDGDSVSFDVSETGTPVLIKTSFFPNWTAEGAEGPYRVSPNFMVVVPTDEHVTVSYGTTNVDRLGWILTIVGLVFVALLALWDQRSRSSHVIERVGAWRPFQALSWSGWAARHEEEHDLDAVDGSGAEGEVDDRVIDAGVVDEGDVEGPAPLASDDPAALDDLDRDGAATGGAAEPPAEDDPDRPPPPE